MCKLKHSRSCGIPRGLAVFKLFLLAVFFPSACVAPRPDPEPVALEAVNGPSGFTLRLNASPGVRINARLKPALELRDGRNIRFDASALTPDSAYFSEPPRAEVSGARESVAGRLRVSVCPAAASYCQTVEIPVTPATITWQSGVGQR